LTRKPRQTSQKKQSSKKPETASAEIESSGAVEATRSGPVIAIDGVEYDASNLSGPAEGALASLRFTEARLMALQSELAVCQTARFAYIKSLREELGLEPKQE